MTPASSPIDWSATGAMAAAIIALGALAISIWSLVVARQSAKAARESAAAAKRVADAEVGRRHEELDPRPAVVFTAARGDTANDMNVWATLTAEKSCRLVVEAIGKHGGTRKLAVQRLVQGGVPVRIHVEQTPEGGNDTATEYLRVRMWPPPDGHDAWTCPCGRPTEPSDDSSSTHWTRSFPVAGFKWPPPPPVYGRMRST